MDDYPFRFHWLFKSCLALQKSMDVPDRFFLGIKLDLIVHFIVPLVLFLILAHIFTPKKALIVLLIIAFLKEFNDFYVYYCYQDIKLKYVFSGLRDLFSSILGIIFIYFLRKYVLLPGFNFLRRILI